MEALIVLLLCAGYVLAGIAIVFVGLTLYSLVKPLIAKGFNRWLEWCERMVNR